MRDKNNFVMPIVGEQLFQAEELLEGKDGCIRASVIRLAYPSKEKAGGT